MLLHPVTHAVRWLAGLASPRPRALATLLALAALGGPLPSTAQGHPQAARLYEDALQRYERQDHAGAAIQLRNALQLDRNNLAVQVLLGRVLLAGGDIVAAEVAFEEALRLGVNRAEVVLPMAQAVIDQGKHQALLSEPRFEPAGLPPTTQAALLLMRAAATADLGDGGAGLRIVEQARTLIPDRADSWLAEVPIRIRSGEFEPARAAASRALELAPDEAEALYVRGQVEHAQGDLAAALRWYDQALQRRPDHTEALISRAGLALDQGRLADVDRDVAVLLRSAPQEPRAMFLRAQLAERRGDAAGARNAFNAVANLLDPVPIEFLRFRPQLLMLGGLSHFSLRQFEKAGPYLELVQRVQPGSPVAKLLARIHLEQRNPERAVDTLSAYLRSAPGDLQAVAMLAEVHLAQGRHGRAAQVAQDALRVQDVPELRTLAGLGLLGMGRIPEAVAELEAALARDPQQQRAGTALVPIYLQSGQFARAAGLAERLAAQQPRNPGLPFLLGQARAAEGNAAAAQRAYEQALQIDPAFHAAQVGLARLELGRGALDAATTRLERLLARDTGHVEAMIEMARIQERRGQLPEARRWLERADDSAGMGNVLAGLALVEFHLAHGQAEAARGSLPRLTAKAPDALPVLLASARTFMATGDIPAARAALNRASGLAGFEAPTLLAIARLQLQIDHLPGATQSLSKVLSQRPNDLQALTLMADVDLRQNELARAEQTARQIVAQHPRAGIGHALLGDIALARGRGAAALDHFRLAQQVEPSPAHLGRVYGVLVGSDAAAANRLADQWLRQHPGDLATRRMLADGHARQGDFAAARGHYEALLRAAPDDAEALNNLANLMILTGDRGALAVAERAMALRPAAAHIIGTTGWAAFQAGDSDRALQLLRDARLRDPANATTRFFLGSVLAQVGRASEARVELRAALEAGGPNAPFAEEARQRLLALR